MATPLLIFSPINWSGEIPHNRFPFEWVSSHVRFPVYRATVWPRPYSFLKWIDLRSLTARCLFQWVPRHLRSPCTDYNIPVIVVFSFVSCWCSLPLFWILTGVSTCRTSLSMSGSLAVVSHDINQHNNQPIYQPINQPISQPINQLTYFETSVSSTPFRTIYNCLSDFVNVCAIDSCTASP